MTDRITHMLVRTAALLLLCLVSFAAAAAADDDVMIGGDVRITPYGDEGCWALVFAGRNFDPPMAKLRGPTYIEKFENDPVITPELKPVGGEVFLRSIQSAIVGPHARLIGYRDIRFDQQSLVLEPNQQVPDLINIGFHERVQSLRMECIS